MRRSVIPAMTALALAATSALADDATDIVAARKFVEPVMSTTCTFTRDEKGVPDGYNNVFRLSYRTKGQDQDSPDYKRTLVQLACSAGAYNFNSIYVLRNDDSDGGDWELLTFAEPRTDFDYVDENFSRLKAPPRVTGYVTITQMTNTEYAEDTRTITANAKWRGGGDAWSAGEWQFEEGVFVLKRYEMDPTYQPPGNEEPEPDVPESYVVFGDPRPPRD